MHEAVSSFLIAVLGKSVDPPFTKRMKAMDMYEGKPDMVAIYAQTVIVRRPTCGIVSGYHELPYVCLGESFEAGKKTARVEGKVQVSPRFLIQPSHYNPSYDDVFGEDNVNEALVGRIFGFLGFRDKPVQCKSEFLRIELLDAPIDKLLSDTLEGLDRQEDLTTGVIITPNAQYYPVSVEKLIASVLDDEFGQ